MTLFQCDNYKVFLKEKIKQNETERAYRSSLVNAAGCQLSFLSQVIHGVVHFTPDHAMGVTVFWGLNEDEREYFMELVHHARAGSKLLKRMTEEKLSALRARQKNLAERYKKPRLHPGEREILYYSSWHWGALHILLTIPRFQSASAIAERLSLPLIFVEQSLVTLESLDLVRRNGKRWVATLSDLHLPKESLLNSIHHTNWRNRAVTDSQKRSGESIHYTAIHSLSVSDFERIKELLLQTIDQTRDIVRPSKEEELMSICIDCFRV